MDPIFFFQMGNFRISVYNTFEKVRPPDSQFKLARQCAFFSGWDEIKRRHKLIMKTSVKYFSFFFLKKNLTF